MNPFPLVNASPPWPPAKIIRAASAKTALPNAGGIAGTTPAGPSTSAANSPPSLREMATRAGFGITVLPTAGRTITKPEWTHLMGALPPFRSEYRAPAGFEGTAPSIAGETGSVAPSPPVLLKVALPPSPSAGATHRAGCETKARQNAGEQGVGPIRPRAGLPPSPSACPMLAGSEMTAPPDAGVTTPLGRRIPRSASTPPSQPVAASPAASATTKPFGAGAAAGSSILPEIASSLFPPDSATPAGCATTTKSGAGIESRGLTSSR